MKKAEELVEEYIKKHPQHKEEFLDMLQLFYDEVEQGESMDNEFTHLEQSLIDLTENAI